MLDAGHVNVVEAAIAASDYVGWVVWVDGNPIFESVPVHQLPVVGDGGTHMPYRRVGRRTMDWTKLPHMRIERAALFYMRDLYPPDNQPIWDCWRELESDVRLIQFKRRASIMSGGADVEPGRTGVMRYTMGTWIPSHSECRLWDMQPNPPKGELVINERPGPRRHPCWPNPKHHEQLDLLRHGFGLGAHVIGITEAEIPDPAPLLERV